MVGNEYMHILLLSAYDAHSHRRWREGLVAAFPEWQWTVLTLPARHFLWRIRGNSLSWACMERNTLTQAYDAVIATSMTDLSALKGLVPELATIPSLVYCHENQFAYPERRSGQGHEPRFTSLYALLSADRVAFNSAYNRDTFLNGAAALLQQMPDAVPGGVTDTIAGKSCILPVPLEQCWFERQEGAVHDGQPFTIVWNHRWEYDKAPERMFSALLRLRDAGANFRVHVIGQQFRKRPAVFEQMYPQLQSYIGAWGTVESDLDYQLLLQRSHVVLSTALHEFQGLAVLEAVASGCIPLAPDRLAYPEFIPADCRYASYPDDADAESMALAGHLQSLCSHFERGVLPAAPCVENLSWGQLVPAYRQAINGLA
jgi:glycosyltransferase involved in cell wall biosynthesis